MCNKKIIFSENKTLVIRNALVLDTNLNVNQQDIDPSVLVSKMDNYIKTKGAIPVGPLIQKNTYEINDEGILEIRVFFIRQANTYIRNTESPYQTISLMRIRDCLYSRFCGPEDKLKFAYDKISLYAFENDIPLNNVSYAVFVGKNDDQVITDVFVERA